MKNDIVVDNRYVVPYNPNLLKTFQAHINMEWCNHIISVKYLLEYINLGYDRITPTVFAKDCNGTSGDINVDEIKQYIDCKYLSPSSAC